MRPKALWHAIVGDQRALTSETHPDDHEPVWDPLGSEWRTCKVCGHIDGGGRLDRLIINVVMLWVVCIFAVWIGYWAFSLIRP